MKDYYGKIKFIDSTYEIYDCYNKPNTAKRARLKLTKTQIQYLEKNYDVDNKPSSATKIFLSEKLDIPVKNIQIWFQNRRAKDRNAKEDEERVLHFYNFYNNGIN